MTKLNLEKCKSGNKGITLIALIITIIVLLILAGITINALTGSDSAPAKANEAEQKNDIGSAKDQIAVSAINAKTTAYETAYVGNSVSAGNAATTIGQAVIDAVLPFNGTSTGKASISVEQTTKNEKPDDAKITITTRDFEVIGTITIDDGILTWGEIEPNIPGVFLDKTGATLNPNGTLTLIARKKNVSGNITWTITGDSTITKTEDSGDNLKVTINVASVASNGDNAIIKASAGGYEATCAITVEKVPVQKVSFNNAPTEIQKGEKVTLTIKATDNSGLKIATPTSITYASTDTTVATIGATSGELEGKKAGTTTISVTASDGTNSANASFTLTVIGSIIGQYVEYGVSYTDMYVADIDSSTAGNQGFTSTNGWRILDPGTKNPDGSYSGTKIISTGVPVLLRYNYRYGSDSQNMSTSNKPTWWGTDEQVETIFGETYSEAGFIHKDADSTKNGYPNYYAAAGLQENFESIRFENKTSSLTYNKGGYSAINNGTTASGEVTGAIFKTSQAESVAVMTQGQMEDALQILNGNKNYGSGMGNLFYLKGLNTGNDNFNYGSASPYYWLASPNTDYTNDLRYVGSSGNLRSNYSYTYGVRPVVSLKSNFKIVKNTETGRWQIVAKNQ